MQNKLFSLYKKVRKNNTFGKVCVLSIVQNHSTMEAQCSIAQSELRIDCGEESVLKLERLEYMGMNTSWWKKIKQER